MARLVRKRTAPSAITHTQSTPYGRGHSLRVLLCCPPRRTVKRMSGNSLPFTRCTHSLHPRPDPCDSPARGVGSGKNRNLEAGPANYCGFLFELLSLRQMLLLTRLIDFLSISIGMREGGLEEQGNLPRGPRSL